jgi:CheY-like chemotaxis protein
MNNQSRNNVLIVEDEPAIRWVLGEALRGWDYETVEAETRSEISLVFSAFPTERLLIAFGLPVAPCKTRS